jgi:microsomal dipeptidase-like Zn-dependent dipeptidase
MPLLRSAGFAVAALAIAGAARAQSPWTLTIRPANPTLTTGLCTPVRIDLLDASGKDSPRNPSGTRVSIEDFDMSIAGAGVVGRYDGPAAWSACGCPASGGGSATITAVYPAQGLAAKNRVPGIALQTSITVPIAAGTNSGVPIGCETLKTTTVPAGSAAPWAVTLKPAANAIAIGSCATVGIDLRDASGKDYPRNPAGVLISLADFDMTVTGNSVAGQYNGAAHWSACGCQGGTVGSPATITATYPANGLAPAARVPGVSFQSSLTIPLSAALGTANPPSCAAVGPSVIAGTPIAVAPGTGRTPTATPTATPTQPAPVQGTPIAGTPIAQAPVPTKTAVPSAPIAPAAPARVLENPLAFMGRQTGDGTVKLWWQPVIGASYYVLFGPGAQGGLKVDTALFGHTVTGVPAGTQQWKVASYYDPGPVSTPAAQFSTLQLTVKSYLLSGWVDLHTHPMVHLAFGGKLIHGAPDEGSLLPADNQCNKGVRATSIQQALSDDRPSHGGWNAITFNCGDDLRKLLLHEFQSGNHALTTASPANGFPDFDQWPKWNDITHQKMWYQWIQRAHAGGLRVMVALATNNKTLADAMSGGSPITGTADGATDDKSSGNLQLYEIEAFVKRHPGFMELAYSAADIKRIVQADKLAVVMGVELDNLGNFNTQPLAGLPTAVAQQLISAEVQRLYNNGARYIFPVHVLDNQFGGTAIYEAGFNTSNLREAGHYWDVECANVSDNITHTYQLGTDVLENILKSTVSLLKLGIDPFRHPGAPPTCPNGPGKSIGHRNALGLTPAGEIAIREMMKRGMIIDIDHMSQKTADAVLDIAEGYGFPVVSGHTGIRGLAGSNAENSRTPRQMERISKLHGMFGLGSDGASAWGWSRLYQSAMLTMGYLDRDTAKATYENGAVSFGTDLNGLVKGPMPGGAAQVVYNSAFLKSTTGTKSWDYNTDGVAHYGMLTDFLKHVRLAPSNGYQSGGVPLGVAGDELVSHHVFRSANYFWQMWERIEARKSSVP